MKAGWGYTAAFGAWFTAGPLLLGSLATAHLVQHGAAALPAWPLLALASVCLLGLGLLPTTLVALLGGYLAGMPSLAFTVGTYLPAAMLGYVIGKAVRPPGLVAWLERRPKFEQVRQRLTRGGWQTVFWFRLSPALPFGISNLVLAWAGISLRALLVGSLPGMLPRTALATYAGMQAHSLQQALQGGAPIGWQWAATLGLLLAAMAGLYLQGRATPTPKA